MKYISVPVFIISLAIGLFMVYVTNPNKEVVYVYPTPDNVENIAYKDKSSTCWKYKAKEVPCNKNTLSSYLIQ